MVPAGSGAAAGVAVSRYMPEVVTVWAVRSPDEESCLAVLEFGYDGEGEAILSPFAQAFHTGRYDDDFAELHFGNPVQDLLREAARTYLTLEEQALRRLPPGEWNGLYLLTAGAGDNWAAPDARPPMPHGEVRVAATIFKLVDTFHVVARPS